MIEMSHDPADPYPGEPQDAASLLALVHAGELLSARVREDGVRDLFLIDTARLDDQRRAILRTLIRAIVGVIGGDLHDLARATLIERGERDAAAILDRVDARHVLPAVEAQLKAETAVATELIDRVTLDTIGAMLPPGLIETPPPAPGPLATDKLRQAESRRLSLPDQPPYAIDLSAETQERFVWWLAAAIASSLDMPSPSIAVALAHAAGDLLARYDEGDRLEAVAGWAALRAALGKDALAGAIDHCLAERRIVVLTALLAQAAGITYEDARAMIVVPGDDRLWLVLRAIDLPDAQLARLGYALGEADRRRDTEQFAERFDAIRAIDPADARAAIAGLRLPAAMRRGMAVL